MTHRRWDRSKSPERYLLSQGLPSGALPPAIRPGLHCGGYGFMSLVGFAVISFPRPSGRGSIAAR